MSIKFNWQKISEPGVVEKLMKMIQDVLNQQIGIEEPTPLVGSFVVHDLHTGETSPIISLKKLSELNEKAIDFTIHIKFKGSGYISVGNTVQVDLMKGIPLASTIGSWFNIQKPEMPIVMKVHSICFNSLINVRLESTPDLLYDTVYVQLQPVISKKTKSEKKIFDMKIDNNLRDDFPTIGTFISNQLRNGVKREIKKLVKQPMKQSLSQLAKMNDIKGYKEFKDLRDFWRKFEIPENIPEKMKK